VYTLYLQEPLLQGDPSAVVPDASHGRDHAVAGHQYRKRVVPACGADSAHGVGISDGLGYLLVGADLPVGDPVQLLHDPGPEIRTVVAEVQVELGALAGEILVDLGCGLSDRRCLALIHRRQVAARKVHAGDHPMAVLGDADSA